jgi:hypothetical protein
MYAFTFWIPPFHERTRTFPFPSNFLIHMLILHARGPGPDELPSS